MASTKLPSFQFYPGDWMKDPNLRRCSKAAVGMSIDMLCLMFECKERGVLCSAVGPWPDREIAAAVGGDISENLMLLTELLTKDVFSRNTSGAVFSRRMVRDEHLRQVRTNAGKTGGSRTAILLKQNAKQNGSKRAANAQAKPGSSSSPSSSPSSSGLAASAAADGAGAPPARASPPATNPAKKTRESRAVRTADEWLVFNRFRTWFCQECYPRHLGSEVFVFDDADQRKRSRNYRFCWKFLETPVIGLDLARAQQAAECAMSNVGAMNGRHYSPFEELFRNAADWWWKSNRKGVSDGNGGFRIVDNTKPGEFASDLPLGVRTYAGEGGGAAAAG